MNPDPNTEARFFWRRLALLGAALTLFSCALWWTTPVQELSERVADTWFSLRTEPQPSPQVVLVFIDDNSLQRYGRWPWPRTLLAELVRKISTAQPRVVGLDILLSEPESEAADGALAEAIRKSGNLVLVDKISGSEQGQLWIEPLPRFADAAAATGHAQALLDSDGICRRFPLAENSLNGPRLAFAEEIVRRSDPPSAAAFQGFYENLAGEQLVQRHGSIESVNPIVVPISFRAKSRDGQPRFTTVSAASVLDGAAAGLLRGKVVMVGFGSSDIHDRLVTPVSGSLPTPGVEIHAHVVDAILSRRLLAPIPFGLQVAALCSICFLSIAAGLRLGNWRGAAVAIAICGSIYLAGFLSFSILGRQSDAGILMIPVLLAVPVVQIEKLVRAERTVNRQLRQLHASLNSSALASAGSDVNWKLEILEQLQAQLATAYEFEHTLLATSHDLIAVFSDAGRLLFCNERFQELWSASHGSAQATIQEFAAWAATYGVTVETAGLPLALEGLLAGNLWNLRLTEVPSANGTAPSIMLVMTDLQARMERDRTRAETLAFVTHELRTPLVSIQGFAEIMSRFPGRAPAEAPDIIFRESRRLIALINSYLDVLRLDSGARPLRLEMVDGNRIVQHVVRVLQPLADNNQIQLLAIPTSDSPVMVQCDEALVTGALMNLASNAIKYGGEKAEVRLSVQSAEKDIVFAVWNNGPAIPKLDLESLFQAFYRGAADRNHKPGWGLGLAFVKRMVEQHNGNIGVDSTESGGTEFRMVLPGVVRNTPASVTICDRPSAGRSAGAL
jgi:CHASE2 domain-containing sensor protein/nitrogen-specific signal transduction histidine kinase